MMSDHQLQQAVLAELNWEPSVNAAHIGVAAAGGVVTLNGHVDSFAQKWAAETAAARVSGVKAVAEELQVRLQSSDRRSDEEIAAAAIARLASDVCVPKDALKVTVEDGLVTLRGQVDWHYQKEAAEQDLRRVPGVVTVFNTVTIKPRVDIEDIEDEILHALHRSWFFDPKTINVTADAGRVRLSGVVRSPHERQIAATTAWAAPGVTEVSNELVVG
jgi:osmotically-inducible protein OsmY